MTKTLPTIEDITRATIQSPTRRINDDGLIQFEYSDDGFIQIYEGDCIPYGNSTIGLADGAKLSKDDWRAIRTRFDLYHNDGANAPFNRTLYNSKGRPIGILTGKIYLCLSSPDNNEYYSLSDELIEKYQEVFSLENGNKVFAFN